MIIDGRKIASGIISRIRSKVAALPFQPVFCDVLVGTDTVSAKYVDLKAKKAESAGIRFLRAEFGQNITTAELKEQISGLNQSENICGLIVQLPLPGHIDRQAVLDAINPAIDVDCLGAKRSSEFYKGNMAIIPPTAAAIMYILDSLKIELAGKNILVLGQGELVGRPVTYLLKRRGLKVSTADKFTADIPGLLSKSDVIVSGTGKPRLITAEKIKAGCVVIDAGTAEDGEAIVGDADFESVRTKADIVSPVPGGVGPVTVGMLLKNVVKVAELLS